MRNLKLATNQPRLRALALCLLLSWWTVPNAVSSSSYHVRIRPQQASGLTAVLSFDFTSSDVNTNTATIQNFTHDGKTQPATWVGGPVSGGLLHPTNPAVATTIGDLGFYAQVGVPIDSLGSQITFTIDLTEIAPSQGHPDELALFLLKTYDLTPYMTADDLGASALFAIDITGQVGGDLSVFAPMTFVAPDSLILDGPVVGVPTAVGRGRLKFRTTPNPSSGFVNLVYEIPEPGGLLQIKVFDVTGRLVATPFRGTGRPGLWTTRWDATDMRGRAVAAGIYIVQLEMGGQSLVRRVVLAR